MANPSPKKISKGPGRPKGVRNKTTREVRAAILGSFESIGGQAGLTRWARENPGDFYKHVWARLIPLEVAGAGGGPVKVEVTFAGVVQGVTLDDE